MKLHIENMKGVNGSFEVGSKTLVRGPVGSGKTTIADAVAFAAIGCVPRVGRSTNATAALMSGGAMSARVEADIGFGRTLERVKSRGGSTLTALAGLSTAAPDAKPAAISDAIRSLFGATDDEAAENLDIVRLLSVSGSELARRVEKLLASAGSTADERAAECLRIWKDRIETNLRPVVKGLRTELSPAVVAAMPKVAAAVEKETKADLVVAIERFNVAKLAAKTEATNLRTGRGSVEDEIGTIQRPTEPAEKLRAERTKAATERATAEHNLDLWRRSQKDREDAQEAVTNAAARVEATESRLTTARAGATKAPTFRAEADGILDPCEIDTPHQEPTPALVDDPSWAILIREANDLDETSRAVIVPELISTTADARALQVAEGALALAEKSPWREVETLSNDIDAGLAGAGSWATKAKIDTDCLRALAEQHGGSLAEYQATVENARAALTAANTAAAARAQEIEAAKAKVAAMSADCRSKRAAVDAARKTATEAHKIEKDRVEASNNAKMAAFVSARAERAKVLTAANERRAALRAEADALDKALAAAERERAEAQAALDAANARIGGMSAALAVDSVACEQTIAEAARTVAAADAALSVHDRLAALEQVLTTRVSEIESAEALRDLYAEAEWAAKRVRDAEIERRASGLEEKIGRFLRAAGRTETPFLRAEKGACEFGWKTTKGAEVLVEALSGGQTVLYRAALAYAVLTTRRPTLRFLTVELAEAGDGATDRALLAALDSIADEVNVIVASCVPVDAPAGWTVIETVRAEAVA